MLLIIVTALLAGTAAFICLRYRSYVRRMLQRLLERMDAAISGDYSQVSYDEGMEAAMGERLNRLLMISKETNHRNIEEREIIQSFLSDVAHQVKIPLSNILIYTQLIEGQEDLSDESREMLQKVCQQSEKLDFLVQSLIKASQLEMEMIKVHPVKESVDELVQNCLRMLELEAEKKNIRLNWKPCKKECRMDMRWMQEALGNILENAVKYSEHNGKIDISVVEYELFCCIRVKDYGCGIREQEQGLIFQRFYRSERVSRQPGLGIGLYLAREIVTQQGGYIEVRSEEGKGTVFLVYLLWN